MLIQLSTPILNFISGADGIIILFVLLIPVIVIITLLSFARQRLKERMMIRNQQTMLLSGILDELKKLNAGKN